MTRESWVRQFKEKLQQQVELEPEQIRLFWRSYCKRRFTQEGRSAHIAYDKTSKPKAKSEKA